MTEDIRSDSSFEGSFRSSPHNDSQDSRQLLSNTLEASHDDTTHAMLLQPELRSTEVKCAGEPVEAKVASEASALSPETRCRRSSCNH
jgi:hypothetical protein